MNDRPTEPLVGQGRDSGEEDRADPEAMARMVDYLIPEARQVSPVVTALLYLARHELSVIAQETDRKLITLRSR